MGKLKDVLIGIFPKKSIKYADMLNGYTPIFSQFGKDIYASDVVSQAIRCIVNEVCKLEPSHARQDGSDLIAIENKGIQPILDHPNPLMSKTEFLEKMAWTLFLNYNAFAVPVYTVWKGKDGKEKRNYSAIYPIQPVHVVFLEDAAGTLFVEFTFANNFKTRLPYSDVIHIRNDYSVNEYMGGNEEGQPDHAALLESLQLNKDLLKGISAAMKSSFAINGVVKIGTMIGREETEQALKDFEKQLSNSESGILPLDAKSDYMKISKDVKLVDADTLKFVDEKILRHFGVPLAILSGDYTKEQYEAFYQKTIEPLVLKFSEAFTKALFTPGEKSFGNKIVFHPRDLIFMSINQKIQVARILGDRGSLYENELRSAFGLKPLKELNGVRMQSLNYVDTNIAARYQLDTQEGQRENEGAGQ